MIYNVGTGGGATSADKIDYDNTDSGLEATNVQDGIDELNSNLVTLENELMNRYTLIAEDIGHTSYQRKTVANMSQFRLIILALISTSNICLQTTILPYEIYKSISTMHSRVYFSGSNLIASVCKYIDDTTVEIMSNTSDNNYTVKLYGIK